MILKRYINFINENNSAFDDIEYHMNGRPVFNTNDQITIDFTHLLSSYFSNKETTKERIKKFNSFYNVSLDQSKMDIVIPEIESNWGADEGEFIDLTLDIISYIWENPEKMENIISSSEKIDKFNI